MKKEDQKLLIAGGIIAVAYFGIINPLLKAIGFKKTEAEKKTEEQNRQLINNKVEEEKKKQNPTKSVAEWKVIADQIYEDLKYSALSDNKANAGYQVARVKNETDFWILFQQFKKRREYLFGIPSGSLMNLQQFINSNLSRSAINEINNNYRRKGIKFQF